jgi:hypothetical protein
MIEEGDVLSCAVKKAVVTRSSDPSIVLTNATYTGILSRDFGTAIRGAIIDRDDFKVGITLGEHAFDRLTEKASGVVAWNDYRDDGNGQLVTSLQWP